MSVTDRFLAELGPITTGQVPKDGDVKYENLVKGLRHIKIKVWPYEAFEEGAEFMEPLAKAFGNAHGLRLKTTFAETLMHILHPISKTAQAETNNPQWAKAIEVIFPKAREMMTKPRYWQAAFPLTITSLCVAPQTVFLKHWVSCFEASIAKLKEKPTRVIVMNGILRLIWTYLYRCQESPSTTATKLDAVLKHFFHSNKLSAFHPDDRFEFLTYVVHFILSRHFDIGREICLELLQESTINGLQRGGSTGMLSSDKIAIAVQATLLSLHLMEKENGVPSWPSTHDFSVIPPKSDYPTSSTVLPAALSSKTVIQEYVNRVGTTLGHIVTYCDNTIGHMSVLEEQWSYTRINLPFEESSNYIIRKHGDSYITAYPIQFAAQINLLLSCFSAWPRCLRSSIPLGDAVEMLLRGVLHVEPSLSEVAVDAVKRIMDEPSNGVTVIRHFTASLFNPVRILQASGSQLLVECAKLLVLWKGTVEKWKGHLAQMDATTLVQQFDDVRKQCFEVEAASLFLLAHGAMGIRTVGVEVIRLLGSLVEVVTKLDAEVHLTLAITDKLLNGTDHQYLDGYEDLLEELELDQLKQRKSTGKSDVILELASSSNDLDKKLWRYVFPSFMQSCMDHHTESSLPLFRDALAAAALRFHPQISQLAGLSNSKLANRGGHAVGTITEKDGLRMIRENRSLIDQWHIWMKIICSTSILPEMNPSGAPSQPTPAHVSADPQVELQKYPNSRYLFKRLTPFLDSEYTLFRDIAVLCISSFPSNVYPQLLEDLKFLAGRQTDYDPRLKVSGAKAGASSLAASMERSRRQERLHSAVARIYFLTAHLLQSQRSTGRQTSLMNILTFIRSTQGFLSSPEMRDNHSLQRLRRYFCGTIERVFDALGSIKDSDRFVAANMHLTLYRLCEEWCQFGAQSDAVVRRLKSMQRLAATNGSPHMEAADATERFQAETTSLSHAAVGALASLCAKALFPPEYSANSPTERADERLSPEMLKPLGGAAVLDRLKVICASAHLPSQVRGRKALKSILLSPQLTSEVAAAIISRAVVLVNDANSSGRQFFEVVADAVCSNETSSFSFSQVVCLGFSNLRHPEPEIRNLTFQMLEAIHQQSHGLLTMSNFEVTAGGSASCAYIHAHRAISDFLAGEHPDQAIDMLKQVGEWLPSLSSTPATSNVILLLLQSLEFWLPHIVLMTEDRTSLSSEGVHCLYYLTLLTLRYHQSHPEQILVMWAKLVEMSHGSSLDLPNTPGSSYPTSRFKGAGTAKLNFHMFFQILRAWTPGYSELADRSIARAQTSIKEAISQLREEMEEHCWSEEDPPEIASHWGSLALSWGTSCSIRSVAFRSLQLFRALMPRVKQGDFALLLGRLTNTIAASDENIQSFTSEILLTITAIAKAGDIDRSLLPQLFWCTCACLSTTVEKEFSQVLVLLDAVLLRIDLDDPSTSDLLLSHRPIDWEGQPFLQQLLLKGLRSSVTSEATMKILQTLAIVQDDRLIDASGGRVRDLYTVSLPWCLNAMVNDRRDSTLVAFAENISYLANQDGRQSIARIMGSFSKGAFRTKDDFMRQSISSLRDHYGSHYWTEIVTLLLGLVLNSEEWLRAQAMQIVKILFQQRETWNPVELLGSELLMPLLRLLETDLAPQALDVLEEPMVMSVATPAKHVLRMSMHGRLSQRVPTTATTVFGVPEGSGWCVAQIDTLREACRANVMAVFDTCSMPTRPSQIIFEPELEAIMSVDHAAAPEDLGGLVKNLHDLTSFFQENGDPSGSSTPSIPSRKLEARVAAILAKSTATEAISDVPQTPFLDVFEVRHNGRSTESDQETDSDTEEDAFVFDSPAPYSDGRVTMNGSRF
ncbi:Cell morphogenesis protein PAG1 [Leucoagaricus sp. SymC.cos]|nr:Cell morphogenesis protein PAG1 [Leucoagaricus sp. SymC.cos]